MLDIPGYCTLEDMEIMSPYENFSTLLRLLLEAEIILISNEQTIKNVFKRFATRLDI